MKTNKKYSKNSGFTVPEDYFENFEEQLLHSLNRTQKLDTSISEPKSSGFKVPDGYFGTLEEKVLTKIEQQEKSITVFSFTSMKKIAYLSGVAAMFAIIISLWNQKTSDTVNFESVAISEIQEYLTSGNVEISNEELAILLDHEDELANTFDDAQLSEEVLEDYLSTEDLENDIYIE